jgi:hypothetical protein
MRKSSGPPKARFGFRRRRISSFAPTSQPSTEASIRLTQSKGTMSPRTNGSPCELQVGPDGGAELS